MNPSGYILFLFCLISGMASAQTVPDLKTDSISAFSDSVQAKTFDEPLKLSQRFTKEMPQFVLPENQLFRQNPNLALKHNQKPQISDNRNTRMPVFKPGYQSNMPVMKPDSSVHYHLLIQRF